MGWGEAGSQRIFLNALGFPTHYSFTHLPVLPGSPSIPAGGQEHLHQESTGAGGALLHLRQDFLGGEGLCLHTSQGSSISPRLRIQHPLTGTQSEILFQLWALHALGFPNQKSSSHQTPSSPLLSEGQQSSPKHGEGGWHRGAAASSFVCEQSCRQQERLCTGGAVNPSPGGVSGRSAGTQRVALLGHEPQNPQHAQRIKKRASAVRGLLWGKNGEVLVCRQPQSAGSAGRAQPPPKNADLRGVSTPLSPEPTAHSSQG